MYFNEIDPKAAAWLEQAFPGATIDQRSILDVTADDLIRFERCHFFGGIGGWELALELAGWPKSWGVWTGSCPCQPFSDSGKRKAEKDTRHLWPEFRRLISQRLPPVIFGEQVASKLGREWLARVRLDLEELGYAVGAADLCAAGAGAPQLRQRLFWVASDTMPRHAGARAVTTADRNMADSLPQRGQPLAQSTRRCQACGVGSSCRCGRGEHLQPNGDTSQDSANWHPRRPNSNGPSSPFWSSFDIVHCRDGKARRIEPGSFPLAHGVPSRVGRLRGYGNAIVPQVAAAFIRAFLETINRA